MPASAATSSPQPAAGVWHAVLSKNVSLKTLVFIGAGTCASVGAYALHKRHQRRLQAQALGAKRALQDVAGAFRLYVPIDLIM
jgi:hypothetical protein